MEVLHQCPICKSEQIVPFSMKYQSGFPHISRTQCKQCQLQFANPMANEKELMDFYSNYYSKGNFGALDYKKKIKEKISQIKATPLEKIKLSKQLVLQYQPTGQFLDIGFGLGEELVSFAQLGFTVFGTEYDSDCIAFIEPEIAGAQLFNGDLLQAGYQNDQFNIINLYHVIEHLIQPIEYVKELHRILTPGGIVMIGTPDSSSWAYQVFRKMNLVLGRIPPIVDGLEHTVVFNKKNLKQLFVNNGFNIIEQMNERVNDDFNSIFKSNLSLRKKIVRYIQTFLPVNQVLIAQKR